MIACAPWPIHALVVIYAAVGAMGCTLERVSDTPDSDDPLACETSGRCGAVDTTTEAQSLTDLPRNGLSPSAISRDALTAQGTQDLLRAIMNGGLLTETTLGTSNRDWISMSANARDLMKYIVSCALGPGESLNLQLPMGGQVSWPGALGLCRNTPGSTFGNWADAPPTPACLELVSSCVLSRVNALQKKVVISMRGESSGLMQLLPKVPVVEEYRENNGTPIASFGRICSPGPSVGAQRSCAWEGRYVGSCKPDSTVTVHRNAPAMLRVCRGIHGCDHYSSDTRWYSGVIGSFGASTDPVTFTCPRNGVSPTDRSYFAIMLAPLYSSGSLAEDVDVTVTGDWASYPSSESEVFTYREGAFFGNIFDAVSSRYPTDSTDINMLVGYQYACHSELWSDGVAHDTDRLCAGPDSPCFENAPGRCIDPCLMPTGGSQPIYTPCSTASPTLRSWTHPITVYLNHPCDLARDITSCKKAFPKAFTVPWNW